MEPDGKSFNEHIDAAEWHLRAMLARGVYRVKRTRIRYPAHAADSRARKAMYHLAQAITADPFNRRVHEAVSMMVEVATEAQFSYLAERMAAEDSLRQAQAEVTGVWPTGRADPSDLLRPWALHDIDEIQQFALRFPPGAPAPAPLELGADAQPAAGMHSAAQPPASLSAPEGEAHAVLRTECERNRDLAATKKRLFRLDRGRLYCEACGWGPPADFGDTGIECHHNDPIAESEPGRQTTVDDLSVVCANCHRLLHGGGKTLTIAELRAGLTNTTGEHT